MNNRNHKGCSEKEYICINKIKRRPLKVLREDSSYQEEIIFSEDQRFEYCLGDEFNVNSNIYTVSVDDKLTNYIINIFEFLQHKLNFKLNEFKQFKHLDSSEDIGKLLLRKDTFDFLFKKSGFEVYKSNRITALRFLEVITFATFYTSDYKNLREMLIKYTNLSSKQVVDNIKKAVPYLKQIFPKMEVSRFLPKPSKAKTRIQYEDIKTFVESLGYELITSQDEFIEEIRIQNTSPSRTKFKVKCGACNKIFTTSWNNLRTSASRSSRGCPCCAGNKKITYEDIQNLVKLRGWILLTTKKEFLESTKHERPSKAKILVKCDKGHLISTTQNYLTRWDNCPKCANVSPIEYEELKKLVEEKDGKLITSIVEFQANHQNPSKRKIRIKCEDGHDFISSWDILNDHGQRKGSWCPTCYGNARKSYEEIKEYMESLGLKVLFSKDQFIIQKMNTGKVPSLIKIKAICPNGHIWGPTYRSLTSGYWCPHCSDHKYEKITRWYLEQMFSFLLKTPITFPTVYLKDVGIKSVDSEIISDYTGYMHYDGFVIITFQGKMFKIAFEYNGIQHYEYLPYFHKSKEHFLNQQSRDTYKVDLSELPINDVKLIIFPYHVDEKMNNPHIIQNYLKEMIKNLTGIDLDLYGIPQFNHISNDFYRQIDTY